MELLSCCLELSLLVIGEQIHGVQPVQYILVFPVTGLGDVVSGLKKVSARFRNDLVNLGFAPAIVFAFFAFGVRIVAGCEQSVRGGHFINEPLARLFDSLAEQLVLGGRQYVSELTDELGIVVEHLLEMGDKPSLVYRIAGNTPTEVVVDSPLTDVRHGCRHGFTRLGMAGSSGHRPKQLKERALGEFWRHTNAAVLPVHCAEYLGYGGFEESGVDLGIGSAACRCGQTLQYGRCICANLVVLVGPDMVDLGQYMAEARTAILVGWREVGTSPEWLQFCIEEHGQRPAALLPHVVKRVHVDLVDVRTFFPVNLDVDEVPVHQVCCFRILEALVGHDVAPVTGRVADGEKDWLVGLSRCGERLFAPGIPVDRIGSMLQQIGAGFACKAVGFAGCSCHLLEFLLVIGSEHVSWSDTIYALSSGVGKAGVAVIRVSGSRASELARSFCGELPEPRKVALRRLRALSDGQAIDEAIVVWFPGPASFTGEDVVEFHVHGSAGVVRWLFEELRDHGGCRPAEAGEFSRRAFVNGRLDLVEAEGLADVLDADTRQQVTQALFHVDGHASEVFGRWRAELVKVLALVEACIDFSDEEGVEAAARPEIMSVLAGLRSAMTAEVAGSQRGRRVRQGCRVVLAGGPNAGKSSLMNAIAARDVAIVSRHAGTTRDVVEVSLDLGGHAVELADTAGLRDDSDSEVEVLGIERSLQRVEEADLVLVVAAPDVAWPALKIDSDAIRVWNKSDVAGSSDGDGADVSVSARTGEGLQALLRMIETRVASLSEGSEPALLVRDRQIHAVKQCLVHLDAAIDETLPLEIVAEEVRSAARLLERLVGKIDVEDLLDDIFSRFCIGK